MYFHFEKIHECEQLIFVCLQLFTEFFIMFYYFFILSKKTGACELGCHCEFPLGCIQAWIFLLVMFKNSEKSCLYTFAGSTCASKVSRRNDFLFSLCKKTKKYMLAICEYMRGILFKIFLKAFKIHILKNGYKYPSYIYSPYSHAWSCGYVEILTI